MQRVLQPEVLNTTTHKGDNIDFDNSAVGW